MLIRDLIILPFYVYKYISHYRRQLRALVRFTGSNYGVIPIPFFLFKGQYFNNKAWDYYTDLLKIGCGAFVSWLYFLGNYYGMAYGSVCYVLFYVEVFFLIILPSGYIKLFPVDTLCLNPGREVEPKSKSRRGYKILMHRRKRSVVRGTVKNPNDHPNGGRTRAKLKYKTPWGQIVPKKRKPKLKYLEDRR
jgi:hypothetical protein